MSDRSRREDGGEGDSNARTTTLAKNEVGEYSCLKIALRSSSNKNAEGS